VSMRVWELNLYKHSQMFDFSSHESERERVFTKVLERLGCVYKSIRETGGVCTRVLEGDCEGETETESVCLCVCGRETCINTAQCLIAAHANVFIYVCVYIHHHYYSCVSTQL